MEPRLRPTTPPCDAGASRQDLKGHLSHGGTIQSCESNSSPTGAASYEDEDTCAPTTPSYFIPGITARARCLSDVRKREKRLLDERTASLSSFSTTTSFPGIASSSNTTPEGKCPSTGLTMRVSSRSVPTPFINEDATISACTRNSLQESTTTLLEAVQEGFDESLQLHDSLLHRRATAYDNDDDSDQIFAWDDDNRSTKKALPPLALWKKENWDELSSSRGSVDNRDQLQYVRTMLEAHYHLGVRRGAEQAKHTQHQVKLRKEDKKKKRLRGRRSTHKARRAVHDRTSSR